jgi:peptidoglycan glycosyltransferase
MTGFTRQLRYITLVSLFGFMGVIVAAGVYATVMRGWLQSRTDNPRLVEAERAIVRGSLYDRHDTLLAFSQLDAESNIATREYLYPSSYSALGYYSYRYGTSLIEATYDDLLRGERLPNTLDQYWLNQPRRGEDIQLTLDLTVQEPLAAAFGDHHGAAIVMTVPNGEVLALFSNPTYNPNTLDANWDVLVADEANPFFNRALQGRYQPGSLLQSALLVTSVVNGQPFSARFPNGARTVIQDDLTLACLFAPPTIEITLNEAFIYGCPAPFTQISPILGAEAIQQSFITLNLESVVLPDNFAEVPTEQALTTLTTSNLRENVLGQGALTVSPLSMTLFTAAIANGGNAPRPYLLAGTRAPDAPEWQHPTRRETTLPYMTDATARRLSEVFRTALQTHTANRAEWAGLDAGGQMAIAYSGDSTQVWFIGFAVLESEFDVVVTVVLEDSTNPLQAASIAQVALRAAKASIESDIR